MKWLPSLILFGVGCAFAFQLRRAARDREIAIPLQFLVFEDRDLETRPAEFWGIAALNVTGLSGAWFAAIYWMIG